MTNLVALDFAGGPEFVDRLQTVWDSGDAVLPLDPNEPPERQMTLATAMGAARIEHLDNAATPCDNPEPLKSGDAAVLTTSGTTGTPKGVILTHAALTANAQATSESLESDANSWWVACLPLNHIGGFSVITRALLTGAKLTVIPKFDPETVTQLANDGCTHISLVPTAAQRVDTASFHRVLLGGSAPPNNLASNIVISYGMTETCGGFVHNGRPLSGSAISIGSPLQSADSFKGPDHKGLDHEGPIFAATDALFRSYRDGTDPTIAFGGVRWFRTGDVGYLDSSGTLSVVGRSSDMIITGGENVWPGPIEALLSNHPSVREVAVVGLPDDEWGEVVTAVVVPSVGQTPRLEELAASVRDRLPRHCAPRRLVTLSQLPKTSLGKLARKNLLDQLLADG